MPRSVGAAEPRRDYQINWKSPTTYAGTCKRLRLDLGEGTYRTADFRFVN
jgi:hypothetical protein